MTWAPNVWNIAASNEAKIVAHLLDADGRPLNISGATAVKLVLKKQDGSYLEKPFETGWVWGEPTDLLFIYGISLTADETASLPIKEGQKAMIKVCFGEGNVKSYIFQNALNVRNIQI